MKSDCEKEINALERKLQQHPAETKTIASLAKKGMEALMRLDERFENGTIVEQREIVGSIFPENLTFNGEFYRTAKVNEVAHQIYMIEKQLEQNKNGTSGKNPILCRKAGWTGLEPVSAQPRP